MRTVKMAMVNADEHCFKNGTAAVTGYNSPILFHVMCVHAASSALMKLT